MTAGLTKTEVRRLSSVHLNGALMYPGPWRFVWAKLPHMPWALVSVEPA